MARVSDEELLRLLREVETQEQIVETVAEEAEALPVEVVGDPCPACGEPAEYLGECHVCGEPGCLPPELWTPGQLDNCLTLCVLCARTIHLGCAVEDGAGNPRCATCRY